MPNGRVQALPAVVDPLLPGARELYTDLHAHPELSMQEHRTAEQAAARLSDAGFEVTTGVGATGVVGVLRNGPGPTVALRADMGALPVRDSLARAGRLAELPTNHSPRSAPVPDPTLRTGVETLVTAAGSWLAAGETSG